MISVLIVDDSAFMRKALSMMLEGDPDIRIVGTARDGKEALDLVRTLQPDVVTMDVEMPRMDGLTALKALMETSPRPVIMISSLTREGADATLQALEAGAVDFIPKQMSFVSLEITKIKDELVQKVKNAARARFRLLRPARPAPLAAPAPTRLPFRAGNVRAVVIGVSTGGPFALQRVIPRLPADFPVPVLVVQHMPPHFTRSLADRLNDLSPLRVKEAETGDLAVPGTVLIAPGGRHLLLRPSPLGPTVATPEMPETLHRPSVDVMFESANDAFRGHVLAVVMTGMGRDGREGARAIRASGGKILTQDEESCVVYGMPKSVVEAGLSDAVLPLDGIAPALTSAVGPAPRLAPALP